MKCRACKDKGWLIFTDNQIQRCDNCEKFNSDLEAAASFLKTKQRTYWFGHVQLILRTK